MAKKDKRSLILMDLVQLGFTFIITSIILYLTFSVKDISSRMICMSFITVDAIIVFYSVSNLVNDYRIKIKKINRGKLI